LAGGSRSREGIEDNTVGRTSDFQHAPYKTRRLGVLEDGTPTEEGLELLGSLVGVANIFMLPEIRRKLSFNSI
jgi:hypothetical protein